MQQGSVQQGSAQPGSAREGSGQAPAQQPRAQQPRPQHPTAEQPQIRVGDRDRDAVAHRLQDAFAEGRLDDEEFDQRMRAALTARLSGDLAVLTRDLPASTAAVQARPLAPAATRRKPAGSAIAYKSSIRRGGRWRVPERFRAVVYKGSGRLDLRAAELTAAETTLTTIAYKSRVDIIVPLGVRIELDGFGVSKGWSAEEELERLLPADAPVVHVRGIGYKGTIEVSTRPQDATPPGRS